MGQVKVVLFRDGNAIGAMIGPDLQVGIAGFGGTPSEALRELANAIEKEHFPLAELDPPRRRLRLIE